MHAKAKYDIADYFLTGAFFWSGAKMQISDGLCVADMLGIRVQTSVPRPDTLA